MIEADIALRYFDARLHYAVTPPCLMLPLLLIRVDSLATLDGFQMKAAIISLLFHYAGFSADFLRYFAATPPFRLFSFTLPLIFRFSFSP